VIRGSGTGKEPSGANVLRLIQTRLSDAEFEKNVANLSNQFAASANHRFKLNKSGQLFIRVHNETLSIVAMRVSNPDCSPVGINRCEPLATPTLRTARGV
jgi:hypothetical protein